MVCSFIECHVIAIQTSSTNLRTRELKIIRLSTRTLACWTEFTNETQDLRVVQLGFVLNDDEIKTAVRRTQLLLLPFRVSQIWA